MILLVENVTLVYIRLFECEIRRERAQRAEAHTLGVTKVKGGYSRSRIYIPDPKVFDRDHVLMLLKCVSPSVR